MMNQGFDSVALGIEPSAQTMMIRRGGRGVATIVLDTYSAASSLRSGQIVAVFHPSSSSGQALGFIPGRSSIFDRGAYSKAGSLFQLQGVSPAKSRPHGIGRVAVTVHYTSALPVPPYMLPGQGSQGQTLER